MDTVEIQPNRLQKGLKYAALLALILSVSVYLFFVGSVFARLLGVISILFFGVGGGFALWKMVSLKGPRFVLSAEGLRMRGVPGDALVPWTDVESAGVATIAHNKMPGLRLKSYEGYIRNLTPEGVAFMKRGLRFLKVSSFAMGAVALRPELLSLSGAKEIAEVLSWNRGHCGFDLSFSSFELDRPVDDFVKLLEEFRIRYGTSK